LATPTHAQSSAVKPCPKSESVEQVPCDSESLRVRVEFQGLNAIETADALKLFRERGLLNNSITSQKKVNEAARVLKGILADRGYMDASVVGLRIEQSNLVRFMVDEGVQYPITSLEFTGNKHFSSDELATRLRTYLADISPSTRSGYDREILENVLHQLANHVRSQGYLEAQLDQPKVRIVGAGLTVTIPITEGPLFRLGNMNIQGVNVVGVDEIRSLLTLAKGDIADAEKISTWLFEDLKRLYGEKGFIEYTAEPVPHFKNDPVNRDEGIVDFDVQIDEGKRFTFRPLTIEG